MEGNGTNPGFFSIYMFLLDAVNLTPQLSAYPLHINILRRSVHLQAALIFFYLSAEKYSTFKLKNLQFYFICFFTTRLIQKSLLLVNFLLKNSAENVYLVEELGTNRNFFTHYLYWLLITVTRL
jgi:hypothetical protein